MTITTFRSALSWLLIGGGAVGFVAGIVGAVANDPRQGEGWGGGVIEAIAIGVPLVVVGLALRSRRREVARRVAVGAGILAGLVALVLVMQLLDPNETTADRTLNAAALVAYLAAALVELPSFGDRPWPPPTSADRGGRPAGT